MHACECLVAAVLLTTAPEAPAPSATLAWAQVCRTSLLALSLDAQLLDPREEMSHFTMARDAAADLKSLQSRFRDFGFAPLIEEARRFPERATINEFLAFNRAYRRDLELRLEVDAVQAAELRFGLAEANHLYQVWTLAADARWEALTIRARREALLQLRLLVGDEAFFRGQLPPYVPVWRIAVAQ
jgi:hypothetical protein